MSAAPSGRRVAPAPTPEAILWETTVVGLVSALGRRRAEKMLRMMTEQMAQRASMAAAIPFRSPEVHSQLAAATQEAVAIYERRLPVLIAALSYQGA